MKLTKILALLLALCMVVSMCVACGKQETPDTPDQGDQGDKDNKVVATDPYAGKTHQEVSETIYNEVLGGFYEYYTKATEAKTVSERFALMAIAEAKLLESGILLPSSADGGTYAISRVAYGTVCPTLWGTDSDRFHDAIIIKGNPFTATEREEMKAKYNELKGTGTYEAWVKQYIADKGYELNDEYALGYTSDPNTWDAFNTYQAADFEAIVNTYDGLFEYDMEGVQQPALATEYTVSDDGLTYTFKIRQGVNWVDSQGKVIEPVTAHSFVKGMQHMMDAQGGLEYLVDGVIKNAAEYMYLEITDFSQVGVKALDDYTLEYTLEKPVTYFTTMLSYAVFAPISDAYFLAKGGAYGVEEYKTAAEAETYTYGKTADDIAYCGPYLVSSATATNSIVFEANPEYWNKDNINIKKISWRFIDGQDPTESYTLMKEGTFAGAGLNTNALAKAKEDNMFDTYAYVTATDATSFPIFFNLYRAQYGNYNDTTVAVSTMTDEQKIATNLAMQNQDFRLALAMSLDRGAFNATTVGDDIKLLSVVNSYTPGNFVYLEEDVTVEINGTATEFKAGTYYGAIMQAQITADGLPVKVWDETLEAGAGSSAGFDGWYNAEKSAEYLAKAVEALKAKGVEVTKENPIVLEFPYYDINEVYANRSNVLKQSMEKSLGGLVEIRLVKTGGSNALNWYYAGYYPETGDLMNYNLTDVCGWGPDYGDPATFLDTMLPQGGGMAKNVGLY